jgi:hypothetical protein
MVLESPIAGSGATKQSLCDDLRQESSVWFIPLVWY